MKERKINTIDNVEWKNLRKHSLMLKNGWIEGQKWDKKNVISLQFIIIHANQFSCSVVSDSLWPHEPQHARPPWSSPTHRVHPNPCPLGLWSQSTISSSVVPFFSFPPSFPASGFFQLSQLFTSGGQSIGVSASTSVLPVNTQDWSPLGWTDWISFQSKTSRVFFNTTVQKN